MTLRIGVSKIRQPVGIKPSYVGTVKRLIELEIKKKGLPDNAAMKSFTEQKRDAAVNIAKAYYSGMFRTVGQILNNPPFPASMEHPPNDATIEVAVKARGVTVLPPSVTVALTPGGRPLSVAYMTGYGPWRALYEKYGPPKRFWKRTGTLSAKYKAWWANQSAVRHIDEYRDRAIRYFPKQKGKHVFHASFFIAYPVVSGPEIIKSILRESFLSGKQYRPPREPFSRKDSGGPYSLTRIGFPEYSRPLLALFAARMGRLYQTALQKALLGP